MLLKEPLEFAKNFIAKINEAIIVKDPENKLSKRQQWWLAFCITAILITNSVCWARFERISLGTLTLSALSWMFRKSAIPWDCLLFHSVQVVLKSYGITEGVLVLDDSDRSRSKNTTQIAHVHKIRDKKTNGYINGQNLVALVLVSKKITIPVGIVFYAPDPVWKAWKKEDARLKKQGIMKKDRPEEPLKNPDYPSKLELALTLLSDFSKKFPEIRIKCILADALYSASHFMSQAKTLFESAQVISQLRGDQLITIQGRKQTLKAYFNSHQGVATTLPIRGGDLRSVVMRGARLHVNAHQSKRYVIALRYEEEEETRYIVATNMTWRMTDIASAYTIRWLVEVFFSDWKSYEGWCQMAKQPGVDGSSRGLILSLLTDHALFFHSDQLALLKNNLPAVTVGSLRDHIRFEAMTEFIREIISGENPEAQLRKCIEQIKQIVVLSPSNKHMNHRTLGRLEPTQSLLHRAAG